MSLEVQESINPEALSSEALAPSTETSKCVGLENIPDLRFTALKQGVLITSDTGQYHFLTASDFEKYCSGQELSPEVFDQLVNKGLVRNVLNFDRLIQDYHNQHLYLFKGPSEFVFLQKDHDFTEKVDLGKLAEFVLNSPDKRIHVRWILKDLKQSFKEFCGQFLNVLNLQNRKKRKRIDLVLQAPLHVLSPEWVDELVAQNFQIIFYVAPNAALYNKTPGGKAEAWLAAGKNLLYLTQKLNTIPVAEISKTSVVAEVSEPEAPTILGIQKPSLPYLGLVIAQPELALLGFELLTQFMAQYNLINVRFTLPHEVEGDAGLYSEAFYWENLTFKKFYRSWLQAVLASVVDTQEENKPQVAFYDDQLSEIITQLTKDKKRPLPSLRSTGPTGSQKNFLSFTGDVSLSAHPDFFADPQFLLGNVSTKTYKNMLQSPQLLPVLTASNQDNLVCDQCAFKPYCRFDAAENYPQHANLYPSVHETQHCRSYKAIFEALFEIAVETPSKLHSCLECQLN